MGFQPAEREILDTNIIIHRETKQVINEDIGLLFNWLDRTKVKKSIHPVTVSEIENHKDKDLVKSFKIKMESYDILKTASELNETVKSNFEPTDKDENDKNDTILINELFCERCDIIITEDRGLHNKAKILNINDKVFTIDGFIAYCNAEYPELLDYKVLSVQKEYFAKINIDDSFFDSFKIDYPGFDIWFKKKSDEIAYCCKKDRQILAFLYLKIEDNDENYADITPIFLQKKRLKIGTFKVVLNGFRLGERFLKIIFDNALKSRVGEIYVTIFDKSLEHERLIALLTDYGFYSHGTKNSKSGEEKVYVRDFTPTFSFENPSRSFPYLSLNSRFFLNPIWPDYHTDLLPDSILNTEKKEEFLDDKPFRNAIKKVYISRSYYKDLKKSDIIIFYRTGGYYKGVVTTIGIVDAVHNNIQSEERFVELCGQRTVFSRSKLSEWWNYTPGNRPFLVHFLYSYSFPKRPNLKWLIDNKIISDI